MKALRLALLLCLGFLGDTYAQNGIKAGYNSSTIGGDASGNAATSGFHAGFFFMKRGEKKTGTMFEIMYSSQGTQSLSGAAKFKYDYILIPILLNIYVSEQAFLQVGAQPGILISANANGTSVIDQLNGFDFSGAVGIGADLDQFILNARYNFGFTSTSKQATGHFPNMVLQLSAGIKFGSKPKS